MLLQRKDIRKKIEALCKYNEAMLYSNIVSALKQIVNADHTSAITITNDDFCLSPEIAQCAQLKIPKSGQVELKFIDRLKAIELLIQLLNQNSNIDNSNDNGNGNLSNDFYSALNLSAKINSINEDGDYGEL